jgi:formylglycine-generating enzyme required for sulfatase activity
MKEDIHKSVNYPILAAVSLTLLIVIGLGGIWLQQDILSTMKEQNAHIREDLKMQLTALKKENAALNNQLKQLETALQTIKNDVDFLSVGKIFRDNLQNGRLGPEMVVIGSGRFMMGGQGDSDEKVLHEVSIKDFAMGRYEVTFADYDRFAEATGRKKPDDNGWGRANRPVINVSQSDAFAYTQWLSQQTGKQYRLPTEAEWEYAARAGTDTKYWWGNELLFNQANCYSCGSQWDNKQTAPIGSFASNAFGLNDTLGNVWEWTCSAYSYQYNGKEQTCQVKQLGVIRGGAWNDQPKHLRVADRYKKWLDYHNYDLGFRLAREI